MRVLKRSRAYVLRLGLVGVGVLGIGCALACADDDTSWVYSGSSMGEAPEVTPACHNCDDPIPPSETSVSSSSAPSPSSGSSYEVNYDSAGYHFGQRIRQMLGLSSEYDVQGLTQAEAEQKRQRWQVVLDVNQRGLDAYQRGEWALAASAFREALLNAPGNAVIQNNLQSAEAQLEAAEAAQRLQGLQMAETRTRVRGVLDNLTTNLNAAPVSSGTLTFQEDAARPSQPSTPFIDSSVVDLRDAKTLIVDPAKVKGEPPAALEFMGADDLRDFHMPRSTGTTPSRKAEILLDALEYGKGRWETSFQYLQDKLKDAPQDPAVRAALANALYAYYLDVGSGGTPEGNPLGRAREPEPTTREIIRDLERLGFGGEGSRRLAAQLKADSAESAAVAPLEPAAPAATMPAQQPPETAAAAASFQTAVYLGTTLATQGDFEGGLRILRAVRETTRDDPQRQQHLNQIIASVESLKDIDEHRTP